MFTTLPTMVLLKAALNMEHPSDGRGGCWCPSWEAGGTSKLGWRTGPLCVPPRGLKQIWEGLGFYTDFCSHQPVPSPARGRLSATGWAPHRARHADGGTAAPRLGPRHSGPGTGLSGTSPGTSRPGRGGRCGRHVPGAEQPRPPPPRYPGTSAPRRRGPRAPLAARRTHRSPGSGAARLRGILDGATGPAEQQERANAARTARLPSG